VVYFMIVAVFVVAVVVVRIQDITSHQQSTQDVLFNMQYCC
jgi:hypothetical protein